MIGCVMYSHHIEGSLDLFWFHPNKRRFLKIKRGVSVEGTKGSNRQRIIENH